MAYIKEIARIKVVWNREEHPATVFIQDGDRKKLEIHFDEEVEFSRPYHELSNKITRALGYYGAIRSQAFPFLKKFNYGYIHLKEELSSTERSDKSDKVYYTSELVWDKGRNYNVDIFLFPDAGFPAVKTVITGAKRPPENPFDIVIAAAEKAGFLVKNDGGIIIPPTLDCIILKCEMISKQKQIGNGNKDN